MRKRICSIALIIAILITLFIVAPQSASAATNTANPFVQGSLVKCCGKLYSAISRDGGRYSIEESKFNDSFSLLENNQISYRATNSLLCVYDSKLYYQTEAGIYRYNPKTSQKKCIYKKHNTLIKMVGICKKGIVISYSGKIYLISFSTRKAKKLGTGDLFAINKNYIFISTSTANTSNDSAKIKIKRYSFSSNKTIVVNSFTFKQYYSYGSSQCCMSDFHAYKNSVIVNLGYYSGTALVYNGRTYYMNNSGSSIKKLFSEPKVGNKLMPGKNCVYVDYDMVRKGKNCSIYKITETGGKSKANSKYIGTTSKDKGVYFDGANTYVSGVRSKSGKKVLSERDIVFSYDSYNTTGQYSYCSATGRYVLVMGVASYYNSSTGWRGNVVRKLGYIVDVEKEKARRLQFN